MFNFAWPWCFVLIPLPYLIYRFWPAANNEQAAVVVPFYDQLTQNTQETSLLIRSNNIGRVIVLSLLWLLLVSAAARPQWVGEAVSIPTSGRDLLLAVDISESMNQQDMRLNNEAVTRIAIVKNVLSEFISQRQGDRIGLVLFGTNAYLQVPLTFDTDTVAQFLEEAQLGFAGSKTAIGEAIGLSVKRLQTLAEDQNTNTSKTNASNTDERVIILLTDGANTAGEIEPVQAAQLAQQAGIKIYTIGIGADEMIMRGLFGPRRVNPSAQLDEVTLNAIASLTQGQYFRARNTDELNTIYQTIESLEPIDQDEKTFRPTQSLFFWPLSIAVLISFIWSLLSIMRFPERLNAFFKKPSPNTQDAFSP